LQTIERVEWRKCLTNDILETYELLGIGAARTLIVQELTKIMSCDGTYVAFPHVWAVADCIVFRGFPMRFSRHGQNRVDTSILQRASFEESAEQLVNAAMFSESDPLQGITPNLILGQVIPAGTGSIGVHTDKVTRNGMETLAPAAVIDIDMNPRVVAHSTMEQTDRDRIDNRTGLARPWTRRLRREKRDGVEQRVQQMAARHAGQLGLWKPEER
jgi:DNA-directed RNA polymerase beta' subunit